jgi:hypothetical protein
MIVAKPRLINYRLFLKLATISYIQMPDEAVFYLEFIVFYHKRLQKRL